MMKASQSQPPFRFAVQPAQRQGAEERHWARHQGGLLVAGAPNSPMHCRAGASYRPCSAALPVLQLLCEPHMRGQGASPASSRRRICCSCAAASADGWAPRRGRLPHMQGIQRGQHYAGHASHESDASTADFVAGGAACTWGPGVGRHVGQGRRDTSDSASSCCPALGPQATL